MEASQPLQGQDKLWSTLTAPRAREATSLSWETNRRAMKGVTKSGAVRPEFWVLIPALPPFSCGFAFLGLGRRLP